MSNVSYERLISLIGDGLSLGAVRLTRSTFEWDTAGRCEAPVLRSFTSRPLTRAQSERVKIGGTIGGSYEWEPGKNHTIHLDMWVTCRRCKNCLSRRAASWRDRAIIECQQSVRTWFGTLTLTPEQHFRVETELRHTGDKNSYLFEKLSPQEQFLGRVGLVGRMLTLYWKRLRKTHSATLRYLTVFEKHKTGLPHIHCLVHETDPARPVRKRALQSEWTHGFTQFRLVENGPHAARYVTKYLTKELATRVRSSLLYGQQSETSLWNTERKELTLPAASEGRHNPPLRQIGDT